MGAVSETPHTGRDHGTQVLRGKRSDGVQELGDDTKVPRGGLRRRTPQTCGSTLPALSGVAAVAPGP